MHTKKVIQALNNWSPKGLCTNTLIETNGEKKKTEACAVGCLALDYLASPEGRTWARTFNVDSKKFVKELYDRTVLNDLPYSFEEALKIHYGLGPEDLDNIMEFNDGILIGHEKKIDTFRNENSDLSRDLKRTILKLRKRYEKFHDENATE